MSNAVPKQISVASLWTEDMPATVRFYRELMGLGICPCQGYYMNPPHFDVGCAYLAILKGKSVLAPDAETFPVLALAVDDLDSAIERLRAHHIALLKDVEEDSASHWVFFRDPGGNLIELAYWKKINQEREYDEQDYTVAIIGGGVSGLSASGLLSQKGMKVKLFEANDKLSGSCANTYMDGTRFMMAPCIWHFLEFWSMSLRAWALTALRS